ncbi:MAG: SEC-C domain-containing protein [Bryobacteraceae bacterium]|jgi:hypothetical protein
MDKRPGRNELCPCGSGVKYKKCHGKPPSALRIQRTNRERSRPRTWFPYVEIEKVESERAKTIEQLFEEELAFIDDCLALAASQVEYLGTRTPTEIEDVSFRDLACDAFEFLYETKRALTRNQSSVLFPLMRRAFESISLLHLFSRKLEFARKWAEKREISNAEVRKALDRDPMTDSIEEIKGMYKQSCRFVERAL